MGTAARIIVGVLLLGSVVQGHLASWALGFLAMLLAWHGFPGMVRPPSVRVTGGRLTADRSGAR